MNKKGSKVIEFKRMLRQYEYSLEDLKDLNDLKSEINSEFGSALASLKRYDLFENQEIENLAQNEEETIIPEERDSNFKKLFRKVVVRCHPDKLDPDISDMSRIIKKDLYEKAVQANDEYNWALLITVAIKLEIDLPEEYYEYIEKLREDHQKVQEKIEVIQNSVAWKWYYAETEEDKNNILTSYISYLEKTIIKNKVPILVLGHPRTGTAYTAKLLQTWGLDVQHEMLGSEGTVDWQLVVKSGPWPFKKNASEVMNLEGDILIYNVRDPNNSIPSIVFTEDTNLSSKFFRLNQIKNPSKNRVEFAIQSILAWDNLIMARKPDVVFRIERDNMKLYSFLRSKYPNLEFSALSEVINSRPHDSISILKEELLAVRPELKIALNEFCKKHGYSNLF